MTNKEAIEILNPMFEQCKGTNYFSKNEETALDLAIKALERDGTIAFEDDEPIVCTCPVCGSIWKKVETDKKE